MSICANQAIIVTLDLSLARSVLQENIRTKKANSIVTCAVLANFQGQQDRGSAKNAVLVLSLMERVRACAKIAVLGNFRKRWDRPNAMPVQKDNIQIKVA